MKHYPIPTNPQPIEQVTITLPSARLEAAAIIVAALSLIVCFALAALAGCASEPPEYQTGAQCVKTKDGKAYVEADGVRLQEGRCTEWRIGPTRIERNVFDQRKAAQEQLLGPVAPKDKQP